MTQNENTTEIQRVSLADVMASKNKTPLVCLTAYTTPMAKIIDQYCDVILVGDSLGMVVYGMDNTLGVTMDMMINHGKAVMRGAKHAFVIVDMPYGSYEESPQQALQNARKIIGETGAQALKLEGGADMAETIKLLHEHDIPVMAHIGLKPQHVEKEGGYRVKGKTNEQISDLINDALQAEKAGAFSLLIEGTIEDVAENITNSVSIPTVGIGASPACDGQILVIDDMLGMIREHRPKFAKLYANIGDQIEDAAKTYAEEVQARTFPSAEFTYHTKVKR